VLQPAFSPQSTEVMSPLSTCVCSV